MLSKSWWKVRLILNGTTLVGRSIEGEVSLQAPLDKIGTCMKYVSVSGVLVIDVAAHHACPMSRSRTRLELRKEATKQASGALKGVMQDGNLWQLPVSTSMGTCLKSILVQGPSQPTGRLTTDFTVPMLPLNFLHACPHLLKGGHS